LPSLGHAKFSWQETLDQPHGGAGCQRNALSNRCHSGVHMLVCSVSAELPPPGGNDAGARRVCRPFIDQLLGNSVSAFLPLLEKVFRKHKHPVGGNWRTDETYIKFKGAWKYLYRAVDKEG